MAHDTTLRSPVTAFVGLVAVQALQTFVGFGSPILAAIGLLAYLTPLPALLLGYHFAVAAATLRNFFAYYAPFCVVPTLGVYLGFLGFDWQVVGQVGSGLTISSFGMTLEAHAGFLRSPEVTAWHAATSVCFLVILGALSKRPAVRLLCGVLIVLLVGAGILTGRRKMLVEIVIFLSLYWCLLAYFRRGARNVAAVAVLTGIIGTVVLLNVTAREGSASFKTHI